jgi:hypothetical protein
MEKENRERSPAEKPRLAECYCTKSKTVRKQLIINEILVEATGVELFRVLITRNLLILGTATTAKKAPLPDPLYVYCTKMLPFWSSADSTQWPQYPIDSPGWIGDKTLRQASHRYVVSYAHKPGFWAALAGHSQIRRIRDRSSAIFRPASAV